MTNACLPRFGLEQGILNCWNMVDDLNLMIEQQAEPDDLKALSRVYQVKFEHLFALFEKMIQDGQIQ